jgi:L-asparaginase
MRDAVADLDRRGVVVALSTRVAAGPVAALYGGGGGADLVVAGAVPTGTLRPSQARMALLALPACDRDPASVKERFSSVVEPDHLAEGNT